MAAAPHAQAQRNAPPASGDPAEALSEALTAACREDQAVFAARLTAENAKAFNELPEPQRMAIMKRFVLLEAPGKPLLSTGPDGHVVLRCEAGGITSEMDFGASQLHDNLAFIPLEIPQSGQQAVRLGLVRENGQWKLLSLGLLMLDIPAMAQQWTQSDVEERESSAVRSLHKIADALESYRRAYGQLPEALDQLGPPLEGGFSPEKAGLVDTQLAVGESGGYRFRYTIVPAGGEGDETERNKNAGFTLAATPLQYQTDGKRSFYLDSGGTLRGADKRGGVATALDPAIGNEAQH